MHRCILAVAVLGAIGCSDATSPSSSTAHHIDALLQQACAQAAVVGPADSKGGYALRCDVLSTLITGPASGAEPSPLQVITAGTSASGWRGLVIAFADTGMAFQVGPSYLLIAYTDPNVTNVFVAHSDPLDATAPYLVLSDTVLVMPTGDGAPAVGMVSTGARCTDTPGLANPLAGPDGYPLIEYPGSICRLATFSVSMTANFLVSGADSGFASVQIPQQNVSGILVTNPPLGSHFRRLR
jgi:hypothetical protein